MSLIMEGLQCHRYDINNTSPNDYLEYSKECMSDSRCRKISYSQILIEHYFNRCWFNIV